MRRAFVITLSVSALALGCNKQSAEAPKPDPTEPSKNPPAPLPLWDEVESGHPEGATNPPSPVLIVGPDGSCYKSWEGGMIAPGPDRVESDCSGNKCGTRIQCPERAKAVKAAAKAAQTAGDAP